MVQFKVLILAKLVIISLNDGCSSQANTPGIVDNNEIIIKNNMSLKADTIVLKSVDYEILINHNSIFDIRIINKLNEFKNKANVILMIEIGDNLLIAKGNFIYSSGIPKECDLFFPVDKNGFPIITNNKLPLRKIPKQ